MTQEKILEYAYDHCLMMWYKNKKKLEKMPESTMLKAAVERWSAELTEIADARIELKNNKQ